MQDSWGDKAATNSRRPDLPAQLGHRGSGRSQPPPHQGPASRTGTRQCPPAADLQPGASSVWAEPRPLVIRVPRHRKYHRCTRSAAPRPCLAADPHPRRVLLGHCGYAPGGGAAPRSAPCPIRSLPRMGPPTRGIVEVAHPRRRRRASPRAGPRRVLLGHSRYDPGWGGASTPAHANTISAPDGSTDPGQWRYRPSLAAASPAARPARGASSWGTAGRAGRRRSTAGAPAQYDLCPRWPDRPGALRVSSLRAAASPVRRSARDASVGALRVWPEWGRSSTAGAPSLRSLPQTAPTDPGHCGYRPCVAAISPAQEPADPRGAEGRCVWRWARPIPPPPFASTH